jgi:hypothetical protein
MTGPSNLPANPTSMGRTLYLYLIISLLALNHFLDDDPRHVQYRKAQQYATASATKNPISSPIGPEEHTSTFANQKQPHYPSSVDSKTPWPYPRDKHPRSDVQSDLRGVEQPVGRRMAMNPSRRQLSDAWRRMRAVTKTAVETGKSTNGQKKKRVSWGDMEVFEYDEQGVVESIIENDSTEAVVKGESE